MCIVKVYNISVDRALHSNPPSFCCGKAQTPRRVHHSSSPTLQHVLPLLKRFPPHSVREAWTS
jgi:hypothetical protein